MKRISERSAHDIVLKVFDYYVDNNNENNEFWELVPTKDCRYHINIEGEQCCHDPKCKYRNEKKYTKKFDEVWFTRHMVFQLFSKWYEELREARRLGQQAQTIGGCY